MERKNGFVIERSPEEIKVSLLLGNDVINNRSILEKINCNELVKIDGEELVSYYIEIEDVYTAIFRLNNKLVFDSSKEVKNFLNNIDKLLKLFSQKKDIKYNKKRYNIFEKIDDILIFLDNKHDLVYKSIKDKITKLKKEIREILIPE